MNVFILLDSLLSGRRMGLYLIGVFLWNGSGPAMVCDGPYSNFYPICRGIWCHVRRDYRRVCFNVGRYSREWMRSL